MLSAHILAALENKLNERWSAQNGGKAPDKPLRLADFFDMVAGTSTGGILACALLTPHPDDPGHPMFGAHDAIDLYRNNGKIIFAKTVSGRIPGIPAFRWAKYTGESIESILAKKFGDARLSQLLRPCLITSYDIEKRRTIFFTSHDAREKGNMYDYYVRDVARCTSAAPTYFPPRRIESLGGLTTNAIDGGLFANNPTMCAVIEALKLFGPRDESGEPQLLNPSQMFILSIGTGAIKKPYFFQKAQAWGLISWVAPIIDIMMTGVSETVDYQLRKLYAAIGKSDQYIRIMPQLFTASDDMDCVTDHNLEALNQAGIQNAYDLDSQLERVADTLLG
ncbi:MAG: patatin-like phospholipase family protein [Saprospirales bacterium]|nr:patatin-like phospholipase family protein [Saprospirales bacterium]